MADSADKPRKGTLSGALLGPTADMAAMIRAGHERERSQSASLRSLFISLFIELTEEPSDPMYGERLNVRLDYKDGYRLFVSSPEGPLMDMEMRRVLETLEGPDDEPDKYVGVVGSIENNGIVIKTH